MITSSTIEQLKGLRLSTVVERFGKVKLKRGNSKCPFPSHEEKTGSFSVSDSKGIFKCFGCGKGGNNPISFVMKMGDYGFVEACKKLADEFNIKIEYEEMTPETKKIQDDRNEMLAVMRYATDNYIKLGHENVLFNQLLSDKSISQETALAFEIGFAPNGWDNIKTDLLNKGKIKPAIQTGIISKGDKGKLYDGYRGRLIIPILNNYSGEPISLAGRNVIEADEKEKKKIPKWLNGKGSLIYSKGHTLFGYPQAKLAIKKEDEVIIVEGYTDVMAVRQQALHNVVGTSGSTLTHEQIKFLGQQTRNFILMGDGDKAGRKMMKKATEKLIKIGIFPTVWILPEESDPHSYLYPNPYEPKEDFEYVLDFQDDNYQDFKPYPLIDGGPQNTIDDIEKMDGIEWLVSKIITEKNDQYKLKKQQKEAIHLLATIKDQENRDIYSEVISNKFDFKIKRLDSIANQKQKEELAQNNINSHNYSKEQKRDIREYGFYEKDNRYWFTQSEESGGSSRSNFIMIPDMIIKGQKRIMEMVNKFNKKVQIEFEIKEMTNLGSFNTKIEGYGNFLFEGTDVHLKKIKRKIYSKEKFCIQPEYLGWDEENQIQIMSNGILKKDGSFTATTDKNIAPVRDNIYYYLPYLANKENKLKWQEHAKFQYLENENDFKKYSSLFYKVHGNCAMVVLLDACVSFFSDLIFREMGDKMPMVFVNGQTQTGKTTMVSGVLSMWGKKQSLIDLSNRSTTKGMQARLSQFSNMPILIDEYKNIDAKNRYAGMLRGWYNRNTYVRKTFSNDNATKSSPIRMKPIIVGTDRPTAFEDLYTRFIIIVYNKRNTDPELLDQLMDMEAEGCSQALMDLIKCRDNMEKNFKIKYREIKKSYQDKIRKNELSSRNVEGLAMFLATYDILSPQIAFPFPRIDLAEFVEQSLIKQRRDFGSSLMTETFWDLFQEAVKIFKIRFGIDYKIVTESIDGDVKQLLKIRFKPIFISYTRLYGDVYKRACPMDKSTLRDHLTSDPSFLKIQKGVRFNSNGTTAMVFDYDQLVNNRGIELYPQTATEQGAEIDKSVIDQMIIDAKKMLSDRTFVPNWLNEKEQNVPTQHNNTEIKS